MTDTTISLVDLIFVNQQDDIVCHGTLSKIADHDRVIVSFNVQPEKVSPRTKIMYDYKNADVNGLIQYITANESSKVNRRAKSDFYNSVKCTMNNYSISAKKKFNILLRLTKNNKFSTIPPFKKE